MSVMFWLLTPLLAIAMTTGWVIAGGPWTAGLIVGLLGTALLDLVMLLWWHKVRRTADSSATVDPFMGVRWVHSPPTLVVWLVVAFIGLGAVFDAVRGRLVIAMLEVTVLATFLAARWWRVSPSAEQT